MSLTPPHNLEAEAAVLGGMLLDRRGCEDACTILSAADFYRNGHRKIFEAAAELSRRSEPVDLLAIQEAVRCRGDLETVGGASYLAALVDQGVTSVNTAYYARVVRESSLRRALISVCREIATEADEGALDTRELFAKAGSAVMALEQRGIASGGPIRLGDTDLEFFEILERRRKAEVSITGLPTGFRDVDKILGGLHPSNMIVLAGRPGHGKTALAVSIGVNVATRENGSAGILMFSLEMSLEEVRDRIYSVASSVTLSRLHHGRIDDSDVERIAKANARVGPAPIFVDAVRVANTSAPRSAEQGCTSRSCHCRLPATDPCANEGPVAGAGGGRAFESTKGARQGASRSSARAVATQPRSGVAESTDATPARSSGERPGRTGCGCNRVLIPARRLPA